MPIKPLDESDLIRILEEQPNATIDKFSTGVWAAVVGEDTLEKAYTRGTEALRAQIAGNATSEKVLWRAVRDSSEFVRMALAANSEAPQFVVDRLVSSKESTIKENLAHNPNASPHALHCLSITLFGNIRLAVARHPNTSAETLKELATDTDREIRKAATKHPNYDGPPPGIGFGWIVAFAVFLGVVLLFI